MTIHSANKTRWPIGALVLHESDAKDRYMLMKVLGYLPNGECRTIYIYPDNWRIFGYREWHNDIKNLHDPRKFGVNPEPLMSRLRQTLRDAGLNEEIGKELCREVGMLQEECECAFKVLEELKHTPPAEAAPY